MKEAIRAKAKELGFDAVGFGAAQGQEQGSNPDASNLLAYIKRGNHGTMAWLAKSASLRASAEALWPQARSVIALGVNYAPNDGPLKAQAKKSQGAVSVHARGKPYQKHLQKLLKALARWMTETYDCEVKVFADTGPIMEKPLAAKARLGWRGKNTLLITRDFGPWLFLGLALTTLPLAPDQRQEGRCGACRACLDACPTGALYEPYRIDARLCISYLTLEHEGQVDQNLRPLMGNRVFGCDDCLASCPYGKNAPPARVEAFFSSAASMAAKDLAALATLDEEGFKAVFEGSPIRRRGRSAMACNALIAIGNSNDQSLADAASKALADDDETVREAARWAWRRLLG